MKYFSTCFLIVCVLAGLSPAFSQNTLDLASSYLEKERDKFGLDQQDIREMIVTDHYTSRHNGVSHIYYRQTFQGIEIKDANLNMHIQHGKVISLHSRFVKNIAQKVTGTPPSISATQAIEFAATHLNIPVTQALKPQTLPQGPALEQLFFPAQLSLEPIPVNLVYVSNDSGAVKLSWYVRIYQLDAQDWWNLWIDAGNGTVLQLENWVVHCNWDIDDPCAAEMETPHDHLHASPPEPRSAMTTMSGSEYNVFPMLVESPNHGSRGLIVDPADLIASPYGWHDTNGVAGPEFTITRGNNVWAQEDRNGNNGTGQSADGDSLLHFDFQLDLNQAPLNYQDASITNLFYWNNLIHDLWYQYGFDELSGNFQANNYGKGGIGDDFVLADAQDGGGFNNANFAAPPDGTSGRMQMFLWNNNAPTEYLTISEPESLVGPYSTGRALFGPGIPTAPITAKLVLVEDGTGNNEGCGFLTNADSLNGKIAVIDRGNCNFVQKIQNAQDSGAIAAIIINNQNGQPFNMQGTSTSISIPAVMISLADGNNIKAAIPGGVIGTIVDSGIVTGIDGSFDNGVVVHEYGHGISIRLTGGPSTSSLNNVEQAGEGWSDWFGLVMTSQPGDNGATSRGIATYATNQPTSGGGIRPFPYSTDMAVNPVTYNSIRSLSIPHGVGSVMCAMLWDLYWNLVDKYGFDSDMYAGNGGNNIAMQLVIDGLKLQPSNPGFVDVRDAILLADKINYAGENTCLIWETFARRGLGFSANQGSPNSRSDGTEAYDLPPDCQPILLIEKIANKERVRAGENLTYKMRVKNRKKTMVTNVIIQDTLPSGAMYVPGSSNFPVVSNGEILAFSIGDLTPDAEIFVSFRVLIDPASPFSAFTFEDSLENGSNGFVRVQQTGTDKWVLDTLNPRSGAHAWFVPNVAAMNDQILILPGQNLVGFQVLSFWHAFNTEGGWDGGVVEILPTVSTGVWEDLGPYMIQNGYNANVGINNPAGQRDAFSGSSSGYIQTKINLATFSGEPVFIRFRFVSDDNTAVEGWYLDDITLADEVEVRNEACVYSDEGDSFCDHQDPVTLVTEGYALGIRHESHRLRVSMFPNPADEKVMMTFEGEIKGEVWISINTIHGKNVQYHTIPIVSNGNKIEVNIAGLAAGVYLVNIQTQDGMAVEKLIIE